MSINMKDCVVVKNKSTGEPTGLIITPKALLLYPNLFEPSLRKGETDKSKAKYGVTVLLHKTADLTPMVQRVEAILKEKLGSALKTTKVKKPFLKVTEDEQPKIYARLVAAEIDPADWPVMIRCYSKQRPVVKGPDGVVVDDETQVYEGRFARVSVNPYWYDNEGKGVSAGLQNVQLLDQGEVIPRGSGGSSGDEFEAVDAGGGSASQMFD